MPGKLKESRSGEIGRRTGLKIPRAQAHVGSIPTSGTNLTYTIPGSRRKKVINLPRTGNVIEVAAGNAVCSYDLNPVQKVADCRLLLSGITFFKHHSNVLQDLGILVDQKQNLAWLFLDALVLSDLLA